MTPAIRPRPAVGIALILGSATLFAVNGTMAKLLRQSGVDAAQVATLRATGAALGLFAVALALRPRSLRVTRRELPWLTVYGLAGFFLVPLLYLVAINRLSVGIALLLEYIGTLLVALWARFVQRQAVRPRLWVGLGLCLAGLACVAQIRGGQRLDPVGVAAGLGAAVLLAAYFLLGAYGSARRDTLSLTAWAFGFAAVAGAVVRPWWNFDLHRFTEPRTALLTAYVVILGTTVPYLVIAAALRHLPATSVSILSMIEVLLAAAVAWAALGEALPASQLAGGALIITGLVLAETARTALPTMAVMRPDVQSMHPNVQSVQDALDAAGARAADGTPSRVQILPEAVHTAAAAAAALDVEVGQIANSLIFDADGEPLLVLTSGAHRADPAKLASLAGAAKVRRATPDFVRTHTGQVIGGVAPLGHPKAVRTIVDASLGQYPQLWAAGGVPQAVFPVTYAELVRVTDGTVAEVA